jgi:hypothetical protein
LTADVRREVGESADTGQREDREVDDGFIRHKCSKCGELKLAGMFAPSQLKRAGLLGEGVVRAGSLDGEGIAESLGGEGIAEPLDGAGTASGKKQEESLGKKRRRSPALECIKCKKTRVARPMRFVPSSEVFRGPDGAKTVRQGKVKPCSQVPARPTACRSIHQGQEEAMMTICAAALGSIVLVVEGLHVWLSFRPLSARDAGLKLMIEEGRSK